MTLSTNKQLLNLEIVVWINSLGPDHATLGELTFVNCGSANGLMLDSTKPLPEPALT